MHEMQNLETKIEIVEIEIVHIAEEAVAAGALEEMVVAMDLVAAAVVVVVADDSVIRKGRRKDLPHNLG
jgi:hypothetical protein